MSQKDTELTYPIIGCIFRSIHNGVIEYNTKNLLAPFSFYSFAEVVLQRISVFLNIETIVSKINGILFQNSLPENIITALQTECSLLIKEHPSATVKFLAKKLAEILSHQLEAPQ
ncbi:MAG TPA: hypothetical protein PLK76_02040 [bacterium]|nr:hypothetical protein [bacterium]